VHSQSSDLVALPQLGLPLLWRTITIARQEDWVRFFDASPGANGFVTEQDEHKLYALLVPTTGRNEQLVADRMRWLQNLLLVPDVNFSLNPDWQDK
jgi:dipeptidyl aminopeptidase/acylaminoacyl peptidase